ncbi:MAG: restriction endonuclease, partial [bacterium]|nr:restriction endonuclease [bacterium]
KTRYGLKQAIMAFGPTGYPFEDFVSKIIETLGYQTKTRVTLAGRCVNHEIDILGESRQNKKRIIVEAKFHNESGIKTNIHVSLYTYARFQDVRAKNQIDEVWLVTNTKITTDAIAYAICMGMKVTSWDYPEGESLRDMIEKSGLTPVTILTTLPKSNLDNLLSRGIVLCRDLHKNPEMLIGLPKDKKQAILEEANFVCKVEEENKIYT